MTRVQHLFPSSKGKEKTQSQSDAANQPTSNQMPYTMRHLAIIMDGNGRWAAKGHLRRLAGHKAGVNALRRVLEDAVDEHIEMLSVYAFSTENWGRPRIEVEGLMRLKACVTLRAGHVASPALAQELQTWCKERLQRYQYPHIVDFYAELPKTVTGKVQRFMLREPRADAVGVATAVDTAV